MLEAPTAALYFPDRHLTHELTDEPTSPEYSPAAQGVQALIPEELAYLPAAHDEQLFMAVEPTTAENVPGLQGVHAVCPVEVTQAPIGHSLHTLAPKVSAYEPAEQLVQSVAPL